MATKRKTKRYDGGGMADDATGVDRAIAANTDTGEWARGENYGDGTTGDERVAMARAPRREATQEDMDSLVAAPRFEPEAETKKTFKQAFAAARGAGRRRRHHLGRAHARRAAARARHRRRTHAAPVCARCAAGLGPACISPTRQPKAWVVRGFIPNIRDQSIIERSAYRFALREPAVLF